MCRVATAEFEATGLAGSTARHWVGRLLTAWDLPGLVDTAELLTSELVNKAVVHAASQPRMVMAVGDGDLDIGVTDRDSCQPNPLNGVAQERSHLSLCQLRKGDGGFSSSTRSPENGDCPLAAGKHVWFRVATGDWTHFSLPMSRRRHQADPPRDRPVCRPRPVGHLLTLPGVA